MSGEPGWPTGPGMITLEEGTREFRAQSNLLKHYSSVQHYSSKEKKDGPGPVKLSDTLCPAVNI